MFNPSAASDQALSNIYGASIHQWVFATLLSFNSKDVCATGFWKAVR